MTQSTSPLPPVEYQSQQAPAVLMPAPDQTHYVLSNSPASRPASWGSVLIIACFAFGFAMSWGTYELNHVRSERALALEYRHDLDLVSSREGDIGQLLSDPRTQFLRLIPSNAAGHDPAWSDVRASLAWSGDRQRGVIFCDALSGRAINALQIWAIAADGSRTEISLPTPLPGRTVFAFSASGRVLTPATFVLACGADAARPSSVIAQARVANGE